MILGYNHFIIKNIYDLNSIKQYIGTIDFVRNKFVLI